MDGIAFFTAPPSVPAWNGQAQVYRLLDRPAPKPIDVRSIVAKKSRSRWTPWALVRPGSLQERFMRARPFTWPLLRA
jgi:hypothetical protein